MQEHKPVTYGYMRVSTVDKQTTDNQKTALVDMGFAIDEFIVEHGVSGTVQALKRPSFKKMYNKLKAGDTVIVTALDRIGRNALDVLTTIEDFAKKGIKFRVAAHDGLDLTSPTGKLIYTVLAAVAEMERNMISERTKMGLRNAVKNGKTLGAPKTFHKEKELFKVFEEDSKYAGEIAQDFGISLRALFNYKKKWKESKTDILNKNSH